MGAHLPGDSSYLLAILHDFHAAVILHYHWLLRLGREMEELCTAFLCYIMNNKTDGQILTFCSVQEAQTSYHVLLVRIQLCQFTAVKFKHATLEWLWRAGMTKVICGFYNPLILIYSFPANLTRISVHAEGRRFKLGVLQIFKLFSTKGGKYVSLLSEYITL